MPIILKPAVGDLGWDVPVLATIDAANDHENRIGVLEAAGSAPVTPPGILPADHGFTTWTLDPVQAGSSSSPTAGVLYLMKVKIVAASTVNGVGMHVATAGSGLTSSYLALFDSTGTRLGLSAAQTTAWQTSGYKATALTAGVAVTAGTYYIGLLIGNGSTTPPVIARASSSVVTNAGLVAPGLRFGASGTGQTSVPSTVTLSGVAADSTAWFAGLTP